MCIYRAMASNRLITRFNFNFYLTTNFTRIYYWNDLYHIFVSTHNIFLISWNINCHDILFRYTVRWCIYQINDSTIIVLNPHHRKDRSPIVRPSIAYSTHLFWLTLWNCICEPIPSIFAINHWTGSANDRTAQCSHCTAANNGRHCIVFFFYEWES